MGKILNKNLVRKRLKFENSLSEQTKPKVCQNSLPTVLRNRNRHVVRTMSELCMHTSKCMSIWKEVNVNNAMVLQCKTAELSDDVSIFFGSNFRF